MCFNFIINIIFPFVMMQSSHVQTNGQMAISGYLWSQEMNKCDSRQDGLALLLPWLWLSVWFKYVLIQKECFSDKGVIPSRVHELQCIKMFLSTVYDECICILRGNFKLFWMLISQLFSKETMEVRGVKNCILKKIISFGIYLKKS